MLGGFSGAGGGVSLEVWFWGGGFGGKGLGGVYDDEALFGEVNAEDEDLGFGWC